MQTHHNVHGSQCFFIIHYAYSSVIDRMIISDKAMETNKNVQCFFYNPLCTNASLFS